MEVRLSQVRGGPSGCFRCFRFKTSWLPQRFVSVCDQILQFLVIPLRVIHFWLKLRKGRLVIKVSLADEGAVIQEFAIFRINFCQTMVGQDQWVKDNFEAGIGLVLVEDLDVHWSFQEKIYPLTHSIILSEVVFLIQKHQHDLYLLCPVPKPSSADID